MHLCKIVTVLLLLQVVGFALAYNLKSASGYRHDSTSSSANRRHLVCKSASLAAVIFTFTATLQPTIASANKATSSENLLNKIYVGCGCFWHLQHSAAVFERDILGRTGGQLTCQTGYAGGRGADLEGRVCYHNTEKVADYSHLGHGEVVSVEIPSQKLVEFIKVYFDQFNPQTKDRRDPMDPGPEYRSLLGFPGGIHHAQYSSIAKVAKQAGFRLVPGKGSDPDTFGTNVVYVYDTTAFPFYQAEIYHQFHNDFQSLPYGPMYNNLANRALEDGRLQRVNCPDRV